MLRRLKTINPKLRWLAGLWIGVEILSLPTIAGVALASGLTLQPDVIAQQVNADQPGTAIFIVTHTSEFSVGVQNAGGDVIVEVQATTDPLHAAKRSTYCARPDTDHLRLIADVAAAADEVATTIVTVTYDPATTPEILLERTLLAPQADSCANASS